MFRIQPDQKKINIARGFWGTLFFASCFLVFGFMLWTWVSEHSNNSGFLEKYPDIVETQENQYHNVDVIDFATINGNEKNPYYNGTYLFEKDESDFQNPDEMLVFYGPVADKDAYEHRILLVCGQHAREMISPEICFHMIQLIQSQVMHPDLSARISLLRTKGVGFWILPLANKWGRLQIENDFSNGCLRKNKNNVDLNRNFKCPDYIREDLAKKEESDPGSHSESELETRLTIEALKKSKPHILFNIHSGIEGVYLPYDCSTMKVPKHFHFMRDLAEQSRKKLIEKKEFNTVNPEKWVIENSAYALYISHGSLVDYALSYHSVPLAYTLEVYFSKNGREVTTNPTECLDFFNPDEKKPYSEVVYTWIEFMVGIVEEMVRKKESIKTK